MADDQGWGDIRYNGHPVLKTPHFDEAATSGLRFDRFNAGAPVCTKGRELLDPATLSGDRNELEHLRTLLRTVRQESLVDMQNDPGEMKNLAKDSAYEEVLQQHRAYLEEFCRKHNDGFQAPEVSE
jgi:hypothetical protein